MTKEDETLLEATLAKDHLKEKAKAKFGQLEKFGGSIGSEVKGVTQKVLHIQLIGGGN